MVNPNPVILITKPANIKISNLYMPKMPELPKNVINFAILFYIRYIRPTRNLKYKISDIKTVISIQLVPLNN